MKVMIDTNQIQGTISPYLHGQFVEFLGHGITDGIWVGRESDIPNIDGLREGIVDALAKLAPPVVRWPGGCYADTYHWRDGIGKPENRPTTYNENFGTYEQDQHQFGTDEFMHFCELIGAEPWLNINLLSGSVQEMKEWMEYCNRKETTSLSNERKANGHPEPYNVQFWEIGNEAWAGGGFMTPQDYVRKYRQYSSAMPTFKQNIFDKSKIYKIASGPDGNKPLERINWTRDLLNEISKYRQPEINALDLHFYNWNLDSDTDMPTSFQEDDWYRVIKGARELALVIAEQKQLIKDGLEKMPVPESSMDQQLQKIDLIVGEWGIWHKASFMAKPALLQQVTMRDAIATAISLNILQENCENVSMACVAQTVNVLNSLIITDQDKTVLTPNFDVFMMYKKFQGSRLVQYQTREKNQFVDIFAAIQDEILTVCLINSHINSKQVVQVDFQHLAKGIFAERLVADDVTDYNSAEHPNTVRTKQISFTDKISTMKEFDLPAASINIFQFKLIK
ncbi:alpha-N-arabinofuranosidase [Lentilactobacillus rapi]|uniref:non-reducing end alpha-L-arabinofuranosidase n=2 Tax=Lentilactobacillus rapi TaxID=481723 RepID=A0A512PPV4_9LACO|nr:alpha-L-arabinofuranosidase C-terminal domain-containing protein [Lentilactobacillus rapi]GEP73217.1 intracellular exo-alpha-L-arabinofuranosidase 2 [Lentilactobacillus rapi]